MSKIRNLTHWPHYWNGKEYVPYLDLMDYHKELEERVEKLKEQIMQQERNYRRLAETVLNVKRLCEIRAYMDHWSHPIDEEPEFIKMIDLAEGNPPFADPVSQDYDAVKDLETSNRETGTRPF